MCTVEDEENINDLLTRVKPEVATMSLNFRLHCFIDFLECDIHGTQIGTYLDQERERFDKTHHSYTFAILGPG